MPDTEHGTRLSAWQHLAAGCIAGAAATAVTYPLETLRTHMAMGSAKYTAVAKWGDACLRWADLCVC